MRGQHLSVIIIITTMIIILIIIVSKRAPIPPPSLSRRHHRHVDRSRLMIEKLPLRLRRRLGCHRNHPRRRRRRRNQRLMIKYRPAGTIGAGFRQGGEDSEALR
uniref:Uncharacterized protein n=1 Tax=Opuntia streptacantha TaxID=393608 RepID=A0A7C9F9D0_OPUST